MEKSHLWNGGRIKSSGGYMLIYNPKHLSAHGDGYVREHLLVMEKHLKRAIKKEEVIHHINGIKDDNRIENLELFKSSGAHTAYHHKIKRLNK